MKTALDISNALYLKVKTAAVRRGQTTRQFVNEALREKLRKEQPLRKMNTPIWTHYFGAFGKTAAMRAETRRIQRVIDEEFEKLESGYE